MLVTKHSPNGNGTEHLDNGRLEQAIARFQLQGEANALGEIIGLTEKRAMTMIRFHKTTRHVPEDELVSDVNFKLLKTVGTFDPARGTAFLEVYWLECSDGIGSSCSSKRILKIFSKVGAYEWAIWTSLTRRQCVFWGFKTDDHYGCARDGPINKDP